MNSNSLLAPTSMILTADSPRLFYHSWEETICSLSYNPVPLDLCKERRGKPQQVQGQPAHTAGPVEAIHGYIINSEKEKRNEK